MAPHWLATISAICGILLPLAEHSVVVNACLLFVLFVSSCSSTSEICYIIIVRHLVTNNLLSNKIEKNNHLQYHRWQPRNVVALTNIYCKVLLSNFLKCLDPVLLVVCKFFFVTFSPMTISCLRSLQDWRLSGAWQT